MARTSLDIREQFQRVLGRDARPDEIQFLGKFIDQNELSLFEVGEIIGGLPEARQQQDVAQRQELQQGLAQDDERILGMAEDRITRNFLKQGRPGSSGRIAAFADAAQNLASQRQKESLNLMMNQFNMQSKLSLGQASQARGRGQDIRQDRVNRERQMEDFRMNEALFNRQLRSQGIRNLQSSLTNAGIGLASKGLGAGFAAGMGGIGLPGLGQEGFDPKNTFGSRFGQAWSGPRRKA